MADKSLKTAKLQGGFSFNDSNEPIQISSDLNNIPDTPPSTPRNGNVYFAPLTKELFIRHEGQWVRVQTEESIVQYDLVIGEDSNIVTWNQAPQRLDVNDENYYVTVGIVTLNGTVLRPVDNYVIGGGGNHIAFKDLDITNGDVITVSGVNDTDGGAGVGVEYGDPIDSDSDQSFVRFKDLFADGYDQQNIAIGDNLTITDANADRYNTTIGAESYTPSGQYNITIGAYAGLDPDNGSIPPDLGNRWTIAMGWRAQPLASDATIIGRSSSGKGTQVGPFTYTDSKCVAFGESATALTRNSVTIGANTRAGDSDDDTQGDGSIAIGTYAIADTDFAIAIGGGDRIGQFIPRTTAYGENSIAMGYRAIATSPDSIAIGTRAVGNGDSDIAIGYRSDSFSNGIAIGSSSAGQSNGIAIGHSAVGADQSVTLGHGSMAISGAVSVGHNASAISFNDIAIGTQSNAIGSASMAVGYQASATGDVSAALGYQAESSNTASMALGYLATTDTDNQLVIGGTNSTYEISKIKTPGFHDADTETMIVIDTDGNWSRRNLSKSIPTDTEDPEDMPSGTIYFNTTNSVWRGYNGSKWGTFQFDTDS